MNAAQIGLLSGLGVLLGGIAGLATAYNAVRSRQGSAQLALITGYTSLVTTLQTEVARLNQENAKQRAEIDGLQRRLLALEKGLQ